MRGIVARESRPASNVSKAADAAARRTQAATLHAWPSGGLYPDLWLDGCLVPKRLVRHPRGGEAGNNLRGGLTLYFHYLAFT